MDSFMNPTINFIFTLYISVKTMSIVFAKFSVTLLSVKTIAQTILSLHGTHPHPCKQLGIEIHHPLVSIDVQFIFTVLQTFAMIISQTVVVFWVFSILQNKINDL